MNRLLFTNFSQTTAELVDNFTENHLENNKKQQISLRKNRILIIFRN